MDLDKDFPAISAVKNSVPSRFFPGNPNYEKMSMPLDSLNLIDRLEQVTVDSTEHLLVSPDDGPTTRQIKGLNAGSRALKLELGKTKLSLNLCQILPWIRLNG